MLNNVPVPGQSLGASRDLINANFITIDTAFSVDHVPYMNGGPATPGQHNQITFPNQTMVPTFSAGYIGLFNQNAAPTSIPDIWMARGTATPYPITGYANGSITSNQANFWTYLPSGMIMIGGQNTTSGGTITITFNNTSQGGLASFPGFTSFVGYITAIRVDNSGASTTLMRVKSYNLTQIVFGLANGSNDSTFLWSALGI
jgi:hypothetical protein